MKQPPPFPDFPLAARPLLGISACLLGEAVRYDAGHKRDAWLVDELSRLVDFRPVCPELAIGLGVPREPIRLVDTPAGVRALGVRDPGRDVTERLVAFGEETVAALPELSGYVFKKNSPSCGMARVKLYTPEGRSLPGGTRGLYAEAFQRLRPELPVEEEGRLNDPLLRENFVTRVLVFQRWQALCAAGLRLADLLAFHTEMKLLLMAHHPATYKALGPQVAGVRQKDLAEFAPRYIRQLMAGLQHTATRRRHVNVLQHILGYWRGRLPDADRQELAKAIADYAQGALPLLVPIHLFKHHLARTGEPYLEGQRYFTPHPQALGLRNPL